MGKPQPLHTSKNDYTTFWSAVALPPLSPCRHVNLISTQLSVAACQLPHAHAKITFNSLTQGTRTVPDHKDQNESSSFRVIDRRPFTSEGEIRPEVVAEQEREGKIEEAKEAAKTAANKSADGDKSAQTPAADTPKKNPAFENLIRMIGSNAAMVLGAYADPRTGQPVIDPEAARELIDMLDALHEKTRGNLAPEEDSLLLDLAGKLKMTYLEINQAMAAQMAQAQQKLKAKP
jgi:Domain of unknown function (DUF1844)